MLPIAAFAVVLVLFLAYAVVKSAFDA